jgi:hypothetical protein
MLLTTRSLADSKIGWNQLKLFSRITGPEKLSFTRKLIYIDQIDMEQIQVSWNNCRRGSGGVTKGKSTFTCVYAGEKILLKSSKEPLSQKCSNSHWSFLTKCRTPGSVVATIWKNIFTCAYTFQKFLTRTTRPEKFKFTWNLLYSGKSSVLKSWSAGFGRGPL